MKMKSILASLMVGAMFCACAPMSNSTTTNSTATTTTTSDGYTTGQGMGSSLKALYGQYKTEGKLNMTNITTLANVATLSSACNTLKTTTKESDFYKNFLKGVVAGSSNLVTNNTAESVVSTVSSTVNNLDLSSIISAVKSNSTAEVNTSTTSSVATSITSLMTLFGNN